MLFGQLKSNWYLDMSHSSFNCSSARQSYSVWLNGNTKPSIIHYRTNSPIFRMLTLDSLDNTCHPPQTVLGSPTNVAYEQNAKATAHILQKRGHTFTHTHNCVSVDIHTWSCKIPLVRFAPPSSFVSRTKIKMDHCKVHSHNLLEQPAREIFACCFLV